MSAEPAGWLGLLARSFRWHAVAFAALNLALTALNVAGGAPWWALWPLVGTGFLLALHFFLYKAFTVDDRWVEGRVAELMVKSYDRGHIEDIHERHDEDRPPGPGAHERPQRRAGPPSKSAK